MTLVTNFQTKKKICQLPEGEEVPRQGDMLKFGNTYYKVMSVVRDYDLTFKLKSIELLVARGNITEPLKTATPARPLGINTGSGETVTYSYEDDDEDYDEDEG